VPLVERRLWCDNWCCRYFQYDSWFYEKDILGHSVVTWDAMPSVFPHGMQYVSTIIYAVHYLYTFLLNCLSRSETVIQIWLHSSWRYIWISITSNTHTAWQQLLAHCDVGAATHIKCCPSHMMLVILLILVCCNQTLHLCISL